MKNYFSKALGMVTLSVLALTGCTPSEGATEQETPSAAPVQEGFDIQAAIDETYASQSIDDVIAGEASDFDINDHRAELKSFPKPTPTPDPTPTSEQQIGSSGESASPQQGGGSQGNAPQQSQQQQSSPRQSQQAQPQQQQQQAPQSRGVNGVYNLTTARNYLAGHCPGVNIESVQGSTSYYDPNRSMIMLGTNMRGGEGRIFFVVMHELMHHYQAQYYSTDEWNAKLANGTLETEADRMTFHVAPGLVGQGHYTNTRASGAELSRIQQIINHGRAAGC